MTDLERARLTYGIIRDFGWDVLWRSANPIPDDAWPIDIIANALATARREGAEAERDVTKFNIDALNAEAFRRGAEEMQERAARALDEDAPWAARAIRALPIGMRAEP